MSGSSCLHTCITCALYSPGGDEIAQAVCVLYTKEGNGQLNMVQMLDLKLCTFTVTFTESTSGR